MGGLIKKIPGEVGVKVFEDSEFCLAADLGQSSDPTALCCMERKRIARVSWKGTEQSVRDEFHVRYLARLPLGLSYVAQVDRIAMVLARPPLSRTTPLVIDQTGVGAAVGDLVERAGLKPIRIVITSGEKAHCKGERLWFVPKPVLISALDARLHASELKFSADLSEGDAMREELASFRRNVSQAGRYSFEARSGKHDDLVLSVALALWNFVGRTRHPVARVGRLTFVGEEKNNAVSFPNRSGRAPQRLEMFLEYENRVPQADGAISQALKALTNGYRDLIQQRARIERDDTATAGAKLVKTARVARKMVPLIDGLEAARGNAAKYADQLRAQVQETYRPSKPEYWKVMQDQEIRQHLLKLPMGDRHALIEKCRREGDNETLMAVAGVRPFLSGVSPEVHNFVRQTIIDAKVPAQAAQLKALAEQDELVEVFHQSMVQSVADMVDFKKADEIEAAAREDAAA